MLLRRVVAGTGIALAVGAAAEVLGGRAFSRLVHGDAQALLAATSRDEVNLVSDEMLDGLPDPVQRYLRYTGVVGRPFVRRTHLEPGPVRAAC